MSVKVSKSKKVSKKSSKKNLQLRAEQIRLLYANFKKDLFQLKKKHLKEFDIFMRAIDKQEAAKIKKIIKKF